ncbi:hypothetical protein GN244_ATG16133 [Phytophthora infestans]|uniref:Uncharacterized protein n=1 Tax=Phytophthora infestans TaxID=4787 RepID=A0A833SU90_PHYIN|nr:hypothetical protein GN244_ATG16133 [Phytophthora infestans]
MFKVFEVDPQSLWSSSVMSISQAFHFEFQYVTPRTASVPSPSTLHHGVGRSNSGETPSALRLLRGRSVGVLIQVPRAHAALVVAHVRCGPYDSPVLSRFVCCLHLLCHSQCRLDVPIPQVLFSFRSFECLQGLLARVLRRLRVPVRGRDLVESWNGFCWRRYRLLPRAPLVVRRALVAICHLLSWVLARHQVLAARRLSGSPSPSLLRSVPYRSLVSTGESTIAATGVRFTSVGSFLSVCVSSCLIHVPELPSCLILVSELSSPSEATSAAAITSSLRFSAMSWAISSIRGVG